MNQPTYDVRTYENALVYEFRSIGPVGTITKVVLYLPLSGAFNTYNLGFGDVDEHGEVTDEVVTNNGDMVKVLATVISTLFVFLESYPTATVVFKGSTPLRTQLYQRIIQSNLLDVASVLTVAGVKNGIEEPFDGRVGYDSFLIRKR